MKFLRIVWDNFVELLFPRRCPICDNAVKPYGTLICLECRSQIRYVKEPRCFKCGKPMDDNTKEYCGDCEKHKHIYKKGMALYEYKSVSDSIYRFKYKGRREYAEFYGEEMSRYMGAVFAKAGVQAFVPVPIHKSKMRKRGYNQAYLIARELSKRTGIPVVNDWVIRQKKTIPLKDLSPTERNNNLRGAFKLAPNGVKLETIVIIDDIYTTGATIDAVSAQLIAGGVKNIYFATLAIGRGV